MKFDIGKYIEAYDQENRSEVNFVEISFIKKLSLASTFSMG